MSTLKIVTLSIIVVFLLCGLTTREAEANRIDNEVIDGNKQCGSGLTERCTPAIHKNVKVEQDENKDGDVDIKRKGFASLLKCTTMACSIPQSTLSGQLRLSTALTLTISPWSS
ncbi:hypothetical protein LINPERHAP1_LOCUS37230 [Linum perenne]